MTDALTAKELVEKTYLYLDKLTKECRKDVMDDLSKARPANVNELARAVSYAMLEWFGRRDRYIRIMFDPRSVRDTPEPGIIITFTGENKDAMFKFTTHIIYYMAGSVCYTKNISINVDKRDFTKR
ncbi:MAG: hypothetical protein FJ358_03530 [Thaumarchaeota archaeon]|nr:hypothetical protein [Nitrososphaerota archaeon]